MSILQPESAGTEPAGEAFDALEPAGFWIRAAARLVDWVVLGALGMAVGIVMMIVAVLVEAMGGRPAADFIASLGKTTFIGWIGSAVATLAYHAGFEGIAGSTIGKRLLRLQILDVAGGPVTFSQGMRRSIGFLVDSLFFGAIGAHEMSESPTKQRIGDRWADTRVVRRNSVPPLLRTPRARMIGGACFGAYLAVLFIAITQICEFLWSIRGS